MNLVVLVLVSIFIHGIFGFRGGMRRLTQAVSCIPCMSSQTSIAGGNGRKSMLMLAKNIEESTNDSKLSSEVIQSRVKGILGDVQNIWDTGFKNARERSAEASAKNQALLAAQLFCLIAVVPGSAACEPFVGWALDLGAFIAIGYGIVLMATAIQGLMAGNNLSFGSEPVSDQIIESGPYDVVRHPLYGGAILTSLGFSLLTMDMWRLILTIGLFLASKERVSSEERYLVDMFGAKYQEYAKNVDKKLLPLLY